MKMLFNNINVRIMLAIAAFLGAIGFGISGICIPPPGEIHGSVLILIAQFLVLSATFVGLNLKFDLQNKYFEGNFKEKTEDDMTVKEQIKLIEDSLNQEINKQEETTDKEHK